MWYSALIRKSSPSIPPFIINVPNFTDYKKLNAEYYSAPFYSSSNGYKMQLVVFANGNGKRKGTHVSVFVNLMKGINDEILKWPFAGDISIHILNWREDNGHVKKIIHFNDKASSKCHSKVIEGERAPSGFGRFDYITLSELDYNHRKNTEYISSNTLCFLIGNVSIPTGTYYYLSCIKTFSIEYVCIQRDKNTLKLYTYRHSFFNMPSFVMEVRNNKIICHM